MASQIFFIPILRGCAIFFVHMSYHARYGHVLKVQKRLVRLCISLASRASQRKWDLCDFNQSRGTLSGGFFVYVYTYEIANTREFRFTDDDSSSFSRTVSKARITSKQGYP